MAQVNATDVTLIRGSANVTINGVVYALVNYKRSAKAKIDEDLTTAGKYRGSSIAEQAEMITGMIRARADQAAPPKFFPFFFDTGNWWIIERELSASQAGVQEYAVTIKENPSNTAVLS